MVNSGGKYAIDISFPRSLFYHFTETDSSSRKEGEIWVMNIHQVIPCVCDRWTDSSLETGGWWQSHAWSQTNKYIIHSNSKKEVDKGIQRSFEAANWTGLWIFSLALVLPLSRLGFKPTDLISTKLLAHQTSSHFESSLGILETVMEELVFTVEMTLGNNKMIIVNLS